MQERRMIGFARKCLRLGIVLTIMLGVTVLILFQDFSGFFLSLIVSFVLWLNGFFLVDIFINQGNVEFTFLNQRKINLSMDDVVKIDNYRNYVFVITMRNRKVYFAWDTLTTCIQVSVDGIAHAGIQRDDFPKAEYYKH